MRSNKNDVEIMTCFVYQCVIEAVSSFLFRGRFSDYQNTFDYVVPLQPDVGVFQSKEWFEWENEPSPLLAGTSLIFCILGVLRYLRQEPVGFSSRLAPSTSSKTIRREILFWRIFNGMVPLGLTTPLANEGYSLTNRDISTAFNEPYLKISADFNSIHNNLYFSDIASLPATITHDLWSSAATRRYIETVIAKGHPDRVIAYVFSRAMFVLPNGHSR